MSAGALMMALAIVLAGGSLVFLIAAMARSIHDERSGDRSVWREFGLGLALMILFFATWVAHLIAEWQTYTDEQSEHGQSAAIGDFVSQFTQSTLENWQSEFLQLFSFVVLAALYIHKGSAESKDGTDKIEASLRRIEQSLGTLPKNSDTQEPWQLPDTPLEMADRES
jgi:hypothetical protein